MNTLNRRRLLGAAVVGIPALVASRALAQSPPGYKATFWYPPDSAAVIPGAALAVGTIYLRPIFIAKSVTIKALAAFISTASAGGNFQLGLYKNNSGTSPTVNRPGSLIDHTANISTTTALEVSALLGSPRSVGSNYFWTAIQCDNTTARFISFNNTDPRVASLLGSSIPANVVGPGPLLTGVFATGTYGVWPIDLSSSTLEDTSVHMAQIALQIQSSP